MNLIQYFNWSFFKCIVEFTVSLLSIVRTKHFKQVYLLSLIENDHLGDWSPEKDCCWQLTFQQPLGKPSSFDSKDGFCTLVVETSVANNSPPQDSSHPDDHFQSRYVTPRFKPFSYLFTLLLQGMKHIFSSKTCIFLLLSCMTTSSVFCLNLFFFQMQSNLGMHDYYIWVNILFKSYSLFSFFIPILNW